MAEPFGKTLNVRREVQLRTYETTFIINSQAEEAQIDRQVTGITDLIKANGGDIKCENRIGTRRLAYAIEGHAQGYYTQLFYEAPQEALPLLDRHLKLEEAYIRFMTVLFEGQVPTVEELNRPIMERDSDHRRGDGDGRHSGRRDDRPGYRDDRPGRRDERPKRVETEETAPAKPAETPVEKTEEVAAAADDTAPVETVVTDSKPIETAPDAPASDESAADETINDQTGKTEKIDPAPESSDDDIL